MKNGMTLTERVLGRGAKAKHELDNEVTVSLSDWSDVEKDAEAAADAMLRKLKPSDNAVRISGDGRFKIYAKAPPIKNPNIKRGYPWRELAVGEAFFAANRHFKINKHITGCENKVFTSYAGELDGKQGRWCKRIK
jgi:hypothetical protein